MKRVKFAFFCLFLLTAFAGIAYAHNCDVKVDNSGLDPFPIDEDKARPKKRPSIPVKDNVSIGLNDDGDPYAGVRY